MNKMVQGGAVALPSVERPLPEIEGTPGLTLLRRLMRDAVVAAKARLSDEERRLLSELVTILDRSMKPAKPEEIAENLRALMLHYPPRAARSREEEASIARDWLIDLGHLPADVVGAACAAWRRGQNSYAPMPGHLLAVADPILNARKVLRNLTRRYLGMEVS